MKKILILLTLTLFLFFDSLKAQDVAFPISDARWCYHQYGDTGEDLGTVCFTPEGIVDINGIEYTKISYKDHPYSGNEEILYREEEGRFYVLPQDSMNEVLVYDFNLEIGDTFSTNWSWGTSDNIDLLVQNVESVTTLDGIVRKQITLSNESYYGTWLEGIGSLDWVFVKPTYTGSVSGGFSFSCHSKESTAIYPNDASDEACDFTSSIETSSEPLRFQISPNPTNDILHIEFLENSTDYLELSIYNANGMQLLHQIAKQFSTQTKVNVQDFANGIYYIILQGKKQRVIQKWVKM